MALDYSWKLFHWSWAFPLPVFYLHRGFDFFRGLQISCGIWVRVHRDRVIIQEPGMFKTDNDHYKYAPLEPYHIRLLELEAGHEGDPLRGRLIPCELVRHPNYEALSYVWGDSHFTAEILSSDGILPITQNLQSALLRLRLEEGKRLLWVDAVCIDQSNISERNHQVEMMARIYSYAENVNIWLGPASMYSELGMEILRWFLLPPQALYNPLWASEPPVLVNAGLRDILTWPWFYRMWVVQEAALSRRVTMMCGHQTISWVAQDVFTVRRFIRTLKFAVISPQWERAGLQRVDISVLLQLLDLQLGQQLDSDYRSNRQAHDLLDHAYEMRDKHSTDRRDKIFALFGLFEYHPMLDDFHVDYRMSVDEIYQKFWERIRSTIVPVESARVKNIHET